jgi:threonine/homoserine/homoserine lactone efflux protein
MGAALPMFSYLLMGATFAFSAAVQPGPFQAYLVSSTLANGWRRTLPAIFAPILSDVPIVCLVLLLLTRVSPAWLDALRVGGGVFLLYLAARAVRAFRHYRHELASPAFDVAQAGEACATGTESCAAKPSWRRRPRRRSRTLLEAVTVNLLNPNPYISWSLVLGPLAIRAWRASPADGVALVAGFYVTMIAATALLLLIFAGARSLGPRIGRAFVGLSACALAGFGLSQLWTGGVAILR